MEPYRWVATAEHMNAGAADGTSKPIFPQLEARMTEAFFNHTTPPLRIGRVRLRVRDIDAVSEFYQRVLGLAIIDKNAGVITLGTGIVPLLDLLGDPSATPRHARDAGLFHIAFLLPSRCDLAHWRAHAFTLGIKLQGASDHIVSEAFYLADPEGNGIEVYADRPVTQWRDTEGKIQMATKPLNIPDLLSAGVGHWAGFPEGGIIGLVHLQVGDIAAADVFYEGILGFDISSRYPGASFFGSGGYHHHLACNIWNSRRAGTRPAGASGLETFELLVRDPSLRTAILARADTAGISVKYIGSSSILHDPWGTMVALMA